MKNCSLAHPFAPAKERFINLKHSLEVLIGNYNFAVQLYLEAPAVLGYSQLSQKAAVRPGEEKNFQRLQTEACESLWKPSKISILKFIWNSTLLCLP